MRQSWREANADHRLVIEQHNRCLLLLSVGAMGWASERCRDRVLLRRYADRDVRDVLLLWLFRSLRVRSMRTFRTNAVAGGALVTMLQAPAGSELECGDLVVGIVRHPDPEPCRACAI